MRSLKSVIISCCLLLMANLFSGCASTSMSESETDTVQAGLTGEGNRAKPDSAIISQNNVLTEDTLVADRPAEVPDSLAIPEARHGKDSARRSVTQSGLGGGGSHKGLLMGLNFTYIGSNNWGTSISYHANPYKSENVPSDYDRLSIPMDYLNIFSFDLLIAFPSLKRDSRFRIEFGPSLVNCNMAEIVPNPNYDPNHVTDDWFWSFDWIDTSWKYKYNKTHVRKNTIGASIMAKLELLPVSFTGVELAFFTNINSFQSIAGIGIYLNFGDVRH